MSIAYLRRGVKYCRRYAQAYVEFLLLIQMEKSTCKLLASEENALQMRRM